MEWQKHVDFDRRFIRPAEAGLLMGDAKKILVLHSKMKLRDLVGLMVDADLKLAMRERSI